MKEGLSLGTFQKIYNNNEPTNLPQRHLNITVQVKLREGNARGLIQCFFKGPVNHQNTYFVLYASDEEEKMSGLE